MSTDVNYRTIMCTLKRPGVESHFSGIRPATGRSGSKPPHRGAFRVGMNRLSGAGAGEPLTASIAPSIFLLIDGRKGRDDKYARARSS